jgi:addiction module HigA family antidote
MIDLIRNEYRPSEVSPPGDTLREILHDRSLTQAELSERMGRPKKTINEIIKGKAAITPETALQLELVLGIPASFWNTREQEYRTYLAVVEQAKQLAAQVQWLKRFPLSDLARGGWLRRVRDEGEQLRQLLTFLGVASPTQWDALYAKRQVSFRLSNAFETKPEVISAWLRCGAVAAAGQHCEPYDRTRFLESLVHVRGLTSNTPDEFIPKMKDLFAGAGVAVALIPQFKGSRVGGSARWLSSHKALIQLSLRYKTNDHFWFTFFHEAAHILLHGKKLIFLDSDTHRGVLETEANEWAGQFLIPTSALREFLGSGTPTKSRIRLFAEGIGVAPGIVVGRLQHDRELPVNQCNDLKVRLEWDATELESA